MRISINSGNLYDKILEFLQEAEHQILLEKIPDESIIAGLGDKAISSKYDFEYCPMRDYELRLWNIGEQIRLCINKRPGFRENNNLLARFYKIASEPKAKRGRESFIMLFAYEVCAPWAKDISLLIDDEDVSGHVIVTLYRMRVGGYSKLIEPFRFHNMAWIRAAAKKYVAFDKKLDHG